jgi:serine/threonine protein kinase
VAEWDLKKAAGAEPLPGYRLIEPLGRGGYGEVWKCEAPGGLYKAIKFVAEDPFAPAGANSSLHQELDAFQRVKAIRHPFLLMLERVELVQGELVMVMELADQSLQTRFDECRAAGQPGIPRDELLGYLTEAAEVLDLICSRYGLQHLDIKPANLFLVSGHLKVGDYGMVAGVEPSADPRAASRRNSFTPKYAPPEVLENRIDSRSDQYGLALVYQELLTGRFPFAATTTAQLMVQHTVAAPDLTPLADPDRPVVQRALAKAPADRFPSCTEFVNALRAAHSDRPPAEALAEIEDTATFRRDRTRLPEGGAPAGAGGAAPGPRRGEADAAEGWDAVFAGFRAQAVLEDGPLGRVVRGTCPDGAALRIRLLRTAPARDAQAQAVVAAVRALAHPGIVQRVAWGPGSVAAFAAPAGRMTLAELYRSHLEAGRPGVPRWDLLQALTRVARTLDEVYRAAGLTHLLLHPAAVFVGPGPAEVADFGPGELLRRTAPSAGWSQYALYAAPELHNGAPGPASDQFSLALIFLEMIQAWSPSTSRSGPDEGQKPSAGLTADRLTVPVWRVVRQALQPDPAQRFADCSGFLAALRAAVYPDGVPLAVLDDLPPVIAVSRLTGRGGPSDAPPSQAVIVQAAAQAACPADLPDWVGGEPVQLADGSWLCRFPVRPLPGLVELKVRVFQERWQFEMTQPSPSTFVLSRFRPGGWWDKLKGKKAEGVELMLRLPEGDPPGPGTGYAEVTARLIGPPDADPLGTAEDTLPDLIREIRNQVQNVKDRRRWLRVPVELPLVLYPVSTEGEVFPPIACHGRNLSAGGFSCTVTDPVPSENVYVEFSGVSEIEGLALLSRLVRADPAGEDAAIVAGRFLGPQ